MNEAMEMTFTIEDADLDKLYDVVKEINVKECPWFEVQDKHGDKAKYYREPQWIPFHKRPLTKEEQKEYKDWRWILDCELPDDNQEVLISSPYFGIYIDTFYNDGECSFDGGEEIKEGMAWMPLPEPYKEEGGEE